MGKTGSDDQRKFRRFSVREGAYTVLRNGHSKIGQLLDISRDGLSLRYINENGTDGFFELDIFLANEGFYIKQVPFKTVTDIEVSVRRPSHSVPMRRRGVQFGNLTLKQISNLEFFIHNFTASGV